MNKVSQKNGARKVIAQDQTVWVGIDVHKKNASFTVLDDEAVLHTETVAMQRRHFDALIARLPGCTIRAVYEAGPTGYQVLRWLREAGVEAMMTAPASVPIRPGDYVKTDKRDSLKLAVAHRARMLEPIWDLTDEQYDDRELLRTREQLVAQRTQVYNRVRSKLLFHGMESPESDRWTKAFLDWLDSGPTARPGIDFSLRSLVRLIRTLNAEITRLDAAIRRLARMKRHEVEASILTSIPGVGPITAMTVLTEIGDVKRFPNAEQFASYLGLVPKERSSGERVHKGGLPRRGNAHVRVMLVQAAWQIITRDGRMRALYERIKQRNGRFGSQVAIVAVARRLACAMRAMLNTGEVWELTPMHE